MYRKKDFRLKSVLNYKSNLVNVLEGELVKYKVTYQQEVENLAKLEAAQVQSTILLQDQQTAGMLDCQFIQMQHQYLQTIKENIVRQSFRVDEAKSQLDHKRQTLAAALKEKKTLEKLKEIHEDEENQRQLRHESETIDDLVIARYNRKEES